MALQTKTISANGSRGHHKFTLTVTENSTVTAENTSSVSWSLTLSPIVKGYDWNYSNTVPVTYSVVFNGTTYSGNIMSYNGTSTVTVRSGSSTISHNADGNKTISYSFSVSGINASYLPGTASASGSMALTYIPRAASIVSVPNFTDEQNPVITYSNPAGNAVTSLKACISLTGSTDDITYRDVPKTGTTYTFQLTEAEKTVLRNATTGSNSRTVYFYLWTRVGGTDYHKNEPRTFTIVNASPTVSGTVTDTNNTTYALTNSRNTLIKYYSNASATVSASPKKGATINGSKYVIKNGSNTWNGSTHTFNGVENNVFTFSAEDSRGNVSTYSLAVPMVNYIKLTCDISNNRPDALGNMTVACSGNYFNGSFGAVSNTLSVQYRYKISTATWQNTEAEWHDMTVAKSGNRYSATYEITIPSFSQLQSYTVQTRAIDKLSTIRSMEQTVRSIPVFHWGENDFVFEVPTSFHDDVQIDGLSGIIKAASGKLSSAVSGSDYATPSQVSAKQNMITVSGILKGAGSGSVTSATAGTDYIAPSYGQANLTLLNGITSQGWYNLVYKCGNVGLVLLAITARSNVSNNTTIANLPSGYTAYSISQAHPTGNTSNNGAIGVNGNVVRVVGQLTAGSYQVAVPYIINQ